MALPRGTKPVTLAKLALCTGMAFVSCGAVSGTEAPAVTAIHPPGTTVAPNGAIVLGPWGHRKVYAPLDRIIVPKHFLGAWADAEEGCDATPPPTPTGQSTEGTKMVIADTYIVASKGRLSYLGAYLAAEGRVSFKRYKSDKPIRLSARKYRNSQFILLWLHQPDKNKTGYILLRTTPESMVVEHSGNGYAYKKLARYFLSADAG